MDQPPTPSAGTRPPGRQRWVHTCERCGATMHEVHCKILCPTCGYVRDCSDP